jgi:hypothetical protein
MSKAWGKVLSRDTPAAQLPAIIDHWTAYFVAETRERLAADPDWSDAERAFVLAAVEPVIRLNTKKTLTDAWLSLQPRQ